jgi:hypothetical protein
MGGKEVRTPDFVPFRVNAKQLHYLVTKGYLPYPNILLDEISDKSKLDRIGKVITCAQITYLILQCIGRALQQLAITTLELFALAIVVCSIAISWCWLHKPADVKFPVKLNMDTSIGNILVEGGVPATRPYQQTPMDFVDDLCPSWYRHSGGEQIIYQFFHKLKRLEDIEQLRSEKAAEPRKLPLKGEFWSIFPLALIYAVARGYLLVEAFLGLRDLEASAFANVNWSAYIPHV